MGLLESIGTSLSDIQTEIGALRKEVAVLKSALNRDLTVREVCERTGLHEDTIRTYCTDGTFPNAYRMGRPWFIPESDLLNIKSA